MLATTNSYFCLIYTTLSTRYAKSGKKYPTASVTIIYTNIFNTPNHPNLRCKRTLKDNLNRVSKIATDTHSSYVYISFIHSRAIRHFYLYINAILTTQIMSFTTAASKYRHSIVNLNPLSCLLILFSKPTECL